LYDPETRLRLKKSSIDSKRLKLSFWTGRDVQRQYAANLRNPVACVNLLAAILGGCGNAKMAANPVSVTLDPHDADYSTRIKLEDQRNRR
jgi:hypothetical protein